MHRFTLSAGGLLVIAMLALLGSGCGFREAAKNLDHSRNLRVGMTKEEVVAVMGEPQQNEVYTRPDLWYYYIEPVWIDGLVTEDECMPLVFKNGKLIGWGRDYYARTRLMPPPATVTQ